MDRRRIWLEQGILEVIESGIDGFNVDVLCSKIGVAKTSFYHFFGSRDNFLDNLIDFWSTEMLENTLSSIDDSSIDINLDKFIRHKTVHVKFYCMYIQVKAFSEIKNNWASVIGQVEKKLWLATDDFIERLIDQDKMIDQAKSLVHTFITGWDYLHAHNVYKKTSSGKRATNELKIFLSSFKDISSNQIMAS